MDLYNSFSSFCESKNLKTLVQQLCEKLTKSTRAHAFTSIAVVHARRPEDEETLSAPDDDEVAMLYMSPLPAPEDDEVAMLLLSPSSSSQVHMSPQW